MGAPTFDKDSFNAGYLIAVSNLVNLHGAEVEAEDVLRELGVKQSAIKALGLTDYDAKPLRKLFRDIARKDAYDRSRRAQMRAKQEQSA